MYEFTREGDDNFIDLRNIEVKVKRILKLIIPGICALIELSSQKKRYSFKLYRAYMNTSKRKHTMYLHTTVMQHVC